MEFQFQCGPLDNNCGRVGYMAILYGFVPEQMKPALNLSQVDEWPEDISELDKCFYEPASIIVTPGKRKGI